MLSQVESTALQATNTLTQISQPSITAPKFLGSKPGKRRKERFILLGNGLLKSKRWVELGDVGRDIYIELKLCFNGFNNGKLACPYRTIRKKYGYGYTKIRKGFQALLALEMIEVAEPGQIEGFSKRSPTLYLLKGWHEKIHEKI